jgi:hypothetical protein
MKEYPYLFGFDIPTGIGGVAVQTDGSTNNNSQKFQIYNNVANIRLCLS